MRDPGFGVMELAAQPTSRLTRLVPTMRSLVMAIRYQDAEHECAAKATLTEAREALLHKRIELTARMRDIEVHQDPCALGQE